MTVYKFRGKRFDDGQYVYGDLIQGDNGVYIKRWEDGCYLTASQFKTRAIK